MTELRIPLLNAITNSTEHFGAGFSVRAATELERANWSRDPFVRDVVPHRVLPEIRAVLVCAGVNHSEESDPFWEDLLVWFGLASLWTGRAVEASFCEEWFRANDGSEDAAPDGGQRFGPPRYLSLSLPVAEAPPWNRAISLDGVANKMIDQIPMFRSKRPFAGTFRFALARWFYSLNKKRRTLEDVVIDLSIALEALFVLETERGNIGQLLRERITSYWWGNEGTKKKHNSLKAKIVDVYDVRSRIVHGSMVDEERMQKARRILDELTREVLGDFVMGRLDNFDPTKYWMPPPEEPCMEQACVGVSCSLRDAR
ncbi:MAG TPA: hypothetical protein VGU66_01945 [Candidatus Elarobacter sp.]|nr:hypothetical protein [Candidatus Elarobacter sp.]